MCYYQIGKINVDTVRVKTNLKYIYILTIYFPSGKKERELTPPFF